MEPARQALYQYYVGWFVFLLASLYVLTKVIAAKLRAAGKDDSDGKGGTVVTEGFKKFQRTYLIVYLVMMAADWLQGPYVYALYSHYGYSQQEIGVLFIAGFASSMVFGTIVGSMADKYGRKKSCLAFAVFYMASCLTKHSPDYNILLAGRVLGGVSTSILFSAFESWMVSTHHDGAYPEEWLGLTFSAATSGNGIIAIVSGVVASVARDQFGPVAPFDVSFCCLAIGGFIVLVKWGENYGDQNINLAQTWGNAWNRLVEDKKIMYLGVIQSFFEGAMYIFVFIWTPALSSTSEMEILHGWIFASFMICVLIGSTIFKFLLKMGLLVERFSVYMFAIAAVSLFVPAYVENHSVRLACFFVFEMCCGCFWPCLGVQRSRYVPEEVRATTMNFFRIPLNMIVVLVLANIGKLQELHVFLACVACLLPALLCQMYLRDCTVDDQGAYGKKGLAVPVHSDSEEEDAEGQELDTIAQ